MKILITGASSGIGYEMTKYLASQNHTIYAVSRNKTKLKKLSLTNPNKIFPIPLDLTQTDNCHKLYNKLKKEKIDILINNAGFGDAGSFKETSLEKELKMIDLNIKAYHILTKLFLKDFIKNDKGRILNVASMAGFIPGPYMATYYATKSYILNLTLSIYEELKKEKSNIKISVFCPGPISTDFNIKANVKFNIAPISASYAAKYAIDNMFENKLLIIAPNMKLPRLLSKIVPLKFLLLVNSNIQEKSS